MELEGRIFKDGKFWLVEVPSIDVMTQGHTRKEALMMIEDAIITLIKGYFPEDRTKNLSLFISEDKSKDTISVSSLDTNLLMSFSLIRQREMSSSTVRQVSERLGSKSPNAYAQYERGKLKIRLDKYERLLMAANPLNPPRLRVV